MQPEIAIIKSSEKKYRHDKKLGGLYPLERNINVLLKAGIFMIYLDLNEEENAFYMNKIRRRITSMEHVCMLENTRISPKKTVLVIPSCLFMQVHYLDAVEIYFQQKKNQLLPLIKDDQFLIMGSEDIRKAEQLMSRVIISNTSGFIAKKINRRISVPISLKVARTRIHPDYITALNILIGFLSSIFMVLAADRSTESSHRYLMMAMSGIFFQMSAVFDGVNSEVAEFTFKDSKPGGRLNIVGDNLILLLFLLSSSYLNYSYLGGPVSLTSIIVLFALLAVLLSVKARYSSGTGSLSTFDTHFLQLLPEKDFLVRFGRLMKYMLKKELFAMAFCLIAMAGMAEIIIPLSSFIILINAVLIVILYSRYKDTVKGY